MNTNRKLVGYHGTTKESAENIIKTNTFKISNDDEEWLGKGIYFFEDDILQAKDWCVKAKCYNKWTIIRSNIEANTLIDLVDRKTYTDFETLAKKFNKRYLKRSDGKLRKLINAVVINAMYEIIKFDVIRAIFPIPSSKAPERCNILPMQVQICVRNSKCIKSIEEVEVV